MEPEIYEGLRAFRRTLDQTVAVLNYLLDNEEFDTPPEEIKGLVELWTEINFIVGNRLDSDGPPTTRSDLYAAIADMNRGFHTTLESLKRMHQEGVLATEFAGDQREIFQELFSGVNAMIMQSMAARELEDHKHYRKIRQATEKRRRSGQTPKRQPPASEG